MCLPSTTDAHTCTHLKYTQPASHKLLCPGVCAVHAPSGAPPAAHVVLHAAPLPDSCTHAADHAGRSHCSSTSSTGGSRARYGSTRSRSSSGVGSTTGGRHCIKYNCRFSCAACWPGVGTAAGLLQWQRRRRCWQWQRRHPIAAAVHQGVVQHGCWPFGHQLAAYARTTAHIVSLESRNSLL